MMAKKLSGRRVIEGTSEHMRTTFRVFDRNSDGFIQVDELKAVMKILGNKLTDQEVNDLMRKADTDGDGQVSFEEFVVMMNH